MADSQTIHAIGRRKEAVCRVYIRPGSGKWDVNGRTLGDYFPRPALVSAIQQPFTATDTLGRYDVRANVEGGGQTGQAGALRLAVARSLVQIDERIAASFATLACSRATHARSSARSRGVPRHASASSSARDNEAPRFNPTRTRSFSWCRGHSVETNVEECGRKTNHEEGSTWLTTSRRSKNCSRPVFTSESDAPLEPQDAPLHFRGAQRDPHHRSPEDAPSVELAQKLAREVVLRGDNVLFVCTKHSSRAS